MLLPRWFATFLSFVVAALPTSAAPKINELMAAGQAVAADEDLQFPDWIEIHNPDAAPLDLTGWRLTDDATKPAKWIFPAVTVPAGGYLVVFCSEKDRVGAGGQLHTNFRLNAGGETLQLAAPDGAVAHTLKFPLQMPDVSYDGADYLSLPTPGQENNSNAVAVTRAPEFSLPHGFYTKPISVELTSATAGATIHYTLDGSEPTPTSSRYEAPIAVSRTTCIRASAFAEGKLPSATVTNTYLFLGDIVKQSPKGQTPPGWPETWGANRVDLGMDPRIAQRGKFARSLPAALKNIPSISIVIPLPDLFDPAIGIYANADKKGRDWERPMSIELINPDGSEGFQVNAGLRIRGGASRSSDNPKHNFRVLFKKEYGAEALEYPLFGSSGAARTEKFDLRCEQLISWVAFPDENADFIRDIYGRDTQAALGQPAKRGDFYHLYINGQYWGLYQTDERVGAEYAAEYFGGKEDDYDTVKINFDADFNGGGTDFIDGSFGAWRRAVMIGHEGFESNENYFNIQGLNADGTRNESLQPLIDVDNLIDYMLAGIYIAADDSPPAGGTQNNWYGVRSRKGEFGFRFFAHDWEISMYDPTGQENRVGEHPTVNPFLGGGGGFPILQADEAEEETGLDPSQANPWHFWQAMRMNPEFRLRVADHVQRYFFDNGALTQENAIARWRVRMEEIDQAVIGESARWGDARQDFGFPFLAAEARAQELALRREAGRNPRVVHLAPGQDEDDLVIDPITDLGPPRPGPEPTGPRKKQKPYTRDTWLRACNEHILGGFLENRTAHVLEHLRAGLLLPSIDAPTFEPHGGGIPVDGEVTIIRPMLPDGITPAPVYVTTNGDDPRLVGGAISSSAQVYATPLRIAKESTLKARAYNPITREWSALTEAVFIPGVNFDALKVTEIHYNPSAATPLNEFVEFQNTGDAEMDVSGLKITGDVSFTFPAGTVIPPAGVIVVARDPVGFAARYPNVTPVGFYIGQLSDSGGRVTVETAHGARVLSVRYDDEDDWPAAPDRYGFSLVYDGKGDPDEGKNWRASLHLHGNPGVIERAHVENAPAVIARVGTDAAGAFADIQNLSNTVLVLGNSRLLHGNSAPFPLPTMDVPAMQSVRIRLSDLGLSLFPTGGELAFQFAAAPVSGGGEPTLVGYVHRFSYGPLGTGVVYGRVIVSDGREFFPRLDGTEQTPRLSSLRIEEFHYHPAPAEIGQRGGAVAEEFVELGNDSLAPAALDGVRLQGFGFNFPNGAQIPASGRVLVVNIDPAVFRERYSIPAEVTIFGPANGSLQDNGERLALETEVTVEGGTTVYAVIEELRYNDKAPWPVSAAGRGTSVQRISRPNYAAEPGSWAGGLPTPGAANEVNAPPRVTLSATATTNEYAANASDDDGTIARLEFIVDGQVAAESDQPTAVFTYRPTNGVHDLWVRAVDNEGAATLSDSITVDASGVPDGAGLGWKADFFAAPSVEGDPITTKIVPTIGGDWFHRDPADGVSHTGFAVRYSGKIVPRTSGMHNFTFHTTGGLRVYLNGELVVDEWDDPHLAAGEIHPYSAELGAGRPHDFVVEYFDDDGLAALSVLWLEAGTSFETTIPPAFCYLPDQDSAAPAIAVPAGLERRFLGQRFSAKFATMNATAGAWSVDSGVLPPGLTLAADGTLSGKPTEAGTFVFGVAVQIGAGPESVALVRDVKMLVIDRGVAAPVVRIATPTKKIKTSGPVLASGTVIGPRPISRIRYALNGGAWHDLPGGNTWELLLTNTLGLIGGDNVLSVQAEDEEGRLSQAVDHHFNQQYPSTLTVTVSGAGRVSAGYLGQSTRIVGRQYKVTATPAPGFLFSGWEGFGTERTLTFTMSDNFVLNALFVPNPFLGAKGLFTGFLGDEETSHLFRGRTSLQLSNTGEFTGTLDFAATRYVLRGSLDLFGNATLFPFDPDTGRGVTVTLAYDFVSGGMAMTVAVSHGWESKFVSAMLEPVPWSDRQPCPQRGRWNIRLPAAADPAPQGTGYISTLVSPRGVVSTLARLPNGKVASQSGHITEGGGAPFYAALGYDRETSTGESLSGLLRFDPTATPPVLGSMRWASARDAGIIIGDIQPAKRAAVLAEEEIFSYAIEALGSRYEPSSAGTPSLNLPEAVFTLNGPEPGFVLTREATLKADNRFRFAGPNPENLALSIEPQTGRVTGEVYLGSGPDRERIILHGIADQAANIIRGFCVDKQGRTGGFLLGFEPLGGAGR